MRGSPVLRFILLALLLAGVAVGVRRVTSASVVDSASAKAPETPGGGIPATPFRLLLSAPASAVEIETEEVIRPDATENPLSGSLKLDPTNPHLSLIVRWKNPPAPGEHRFARLTLEPPGQETFIHVFDANGDIDDFLELPLPAAP